MRKNISFVVVLNILVVLLIGCNGKEQKEDQQKDPQKDKPAATSQVNIQVPEINADSAYAFVKQQVDFGPRIPGSKSHAHCADWLEAKLKSYFPEVLSQKAIVTTFDQMKYEMRNVIASYNPENKNRILLCAHWDTRPFADREEGAKKNAIFDGANDGASGVGVLLEVARQIQIAKPGIGVDIIFFDLEDYGQPDDSKLAQMKDSWCLGSQYWAKNPHESGYFAKFGILLDMVGAKGAVFPKEGNSVYYAPGVVEKVWNTASKLNYSNYFINAEGNAITDDHVYINQFANIPCIDIVHYDIINSDFFAHHHRVTDNMDQIDANVLKMVGQTVLQVVMEESVQSTN
ncbi:MAG TPA: M28 family peptidase [Bacteroidia bacterium]|nr:M28 family peptidase [Bacteroidia bacterium]